MGQLCAFATVSGLSSCMTGVVNLSTSGVLIVEATSGDGINLVFIGFEHRVDPVACLR